VFVALGIQHAKCIRRIVICGLFGSTLFFHGMIFEKEKVLEHKMYVLIFFATSATFLILRRSARDVIKNVYRSLCKVRVDFSYM